MFPDQIDACIGAADGAACSASTVTNGLCHLGVCISSGCGNGVVEPGEQCDDGNRFSLDGCSADCTSDERCGNGLVDLALGESCDCGDGSATTPGTCSGANSNAPGASCRPNCKLATCGDGIVDPGEWCDDGNHVPGDGCRADCTGPFTAMASGTLKDLRGVWASGPNDAFAVGDQRILHYDGVAWSKMVPPASASYVAVCGNALGVFAVGSGRVDQYDGAAWTTMILPSGLVALSAACTPTQLIVGGSNATNGAVATWDGTTWTTLPPLLASIVPLAVMAVWQFTGGDPYAIITTPGSYPPHTKLQRYVTGSWQDVPTAALNTDISSAVWGTSPDNVFVLSPVQRYDGSTWTQDPGSDEGYADAFGGVANDVFAVGSANNIGFVSVFDGTSWSLLPVPLTPVLTAVSSYASGRAFVVGSQGTILY